MQNSQEVRSAPFQGFGEKRKSLDNVADTEHLRDTRSRSLSAARFDSFGGGKLQITVRAGSCPLAVKTHRRDQLVEIHLVQELQSVLHFVVAFLSLDKFCQRSELG